jgi:hypothetical protein
MRMRDPHEREARARQISVELREQVRMATSMKVVPGPAVLQKKGPADPVTTPPVG